MTPMISTTLVRTKTGQAGGGREGDAVEEKVARLPLQTEFHVLGAAGGVVGHTYPTAGG